MEVIIILNGGSSSLKFKLFAAQDLKDLYSGQISGIGTNNPKLIIKDSSEWKLLKTHNFSESQNRDDMLIFIIENLRELFPTLSLIAAGHRVVHGGNHYMLPSLVDNKLINTLKDISYLSPIHLPHNIRPMEVLQAKFPQLRQIACFDTAFHSTNSKISQYYAIPRKFIEEDNIKRYGFHGLSYEYLALKLHEIDKTAASGKVIACHLGAGASLCAMENGKSITTTMGVTPLDGLVMGSRTGAIDPGIILYLLQHKGFNATSLEKLLYFESGILGVSDLSSDFYTVASSTDTKAIEAWDLYKFNLIKQIGAMFAVLGGFNSIIFTGGVGENTKSLRTHVANSFSWLGMKIANNLNTNPENYLISESNSSIKMFVIPAQEEWMIAKHVQQTIQL